MAARGRCGLRLAPVVDDSCFGALRLGRLTQSFDLTDELHTAIRTIRVVCARVAIRFLCQHFEQRLTRRFDALVLPLTSMFDDVLTPNQSAAANRRPALQQDGADNLAATVAADRALPAAVAGLGR